MPYGPHRRAARPPPPLDPATAPPPHCLHRLTPSPERPSRRVGRPAPCHGGRTAPYPSEHRSLPWRTCGTTPSPTTPSPKARTRSAGTPPRRGPCPRTSRRCSPSTPSPTATAGSPGRCATCPGARWNSATARSAPTYPGCGPAGSARSSGRSRCPGDEGASLTRTLEQLDFARAVVAAHPGALRLARTSYDVADAHGRGRIAVVPGPADARGIDDSLAGLRTLAELGVRSLTLAGARWAGEEGLSVFGTEVVRETNRLGMLLDLTGAPAAVVARVLDISRAPALLRAG
ncbi:membrane dipeptidase, partial [Streptomyces sp. SA3_actF]|uniref:membrane dipeptidase n=1 Tax=Streptomyces sp. SA3_actF TaxID=682181 RepID=UPI001F42D36B